MESVKRQFLVPDGRYRRAVTATTASAPPTPPDDPDEPGEAERAVDDRPGRGWLVRAAVVVMAFSFLAGAVGYAIGVRQEKTPSNATDVGFLAGAVGYAVGVRQQRTPSNAVDVGFLVDMSDHHDQAVTMALTVYNRTTDPTIRGFAQDVLVFQRSELGRMAAYLEDHDAVRPDYDPDRPAMAWMGMPMAASRMTGMASEDQLTALAEATGRELDLMFLDLMTVHHRGGIEMADYAAVHAADPRVRTLATRIARQQTSEIEEYAQYRATIAP